MFEVNHQKVEKFYDCISETASILYKHLSKSYLDALILAIKYLLDGEIINDDLDAETIAELNRHYQALEQESFNPEEMRRAYQLALLFGLKQDHRSLSQITPDSIGLLLTYFIERFYDQKTVIDILDATVGSGNLLVSILNQTKREFRHIYGVDKDYQQLELALSLAELIDYDIEFIHQDSRKPLIVPQFNLIIADLPSGYEPLTNNPDVPVEIIENLMQYNQAGGFFFYLIPADLFSRENSQKLKEVILNHSHIQALISLPDSMFKTKEAKKAILILRKRGPEILPTKEILVLEMPSMQQRDQVKQALNRFDQWFAQNYHKSMED